MTVGAGVGAGVFLRPALSVTAMLPPPKTTRIIKDIKKASLISRISRLSYTLVIKSI